MEWNYVRFKFSFGANDCLSGGQYPNPNGINQIDFGVIQTHTSPPQVSDALAETFVTEIDGKFFECDIRFNSSYSWYTGTGTPPSDQIDWWSVAAHEMGHCLGLTHEDKVTPKPVMSTGGLVRTLTADDIAGRDTLYGPEGRIVVSNDEWPLSNEGFDMTPEDAKRFALNLANSFASAGSGHFLIYSTRFDKTTGLVGTGLLDTLRAAGHTVEIIDTTRSFTVADLIQYDAIFLAGSTADDFNNPRPVTPPGTQVLIDYVKAGGNIYIASGTDPDLPQSEAHQWNQLLNSCGLQLANNLNNINQIVPINSPSSLFAGIHRLLQQNGTSISKVTSTNPRASILVSLQGQGLYAECSFNPQIVNDFVDFVALRPSFSTAPPEPDCPSANYAGKFEFDALLTGKSGIPAIESIKAQVTAISQGNTVLSADLPQANRAGATMIFPLRDGLADGALAAGDSVPLHVIICLQQIKPFFLTVDVLGRIGGSGTTHNVSNVEELFNAINEANDEFTHKGADTINMVPGTYTLSGPLPSITSEISLNGNGSIIERSSAVATQEFGISRVQTSGKLSLNNLTIRNGRATRGGGIFNIGTLTMHNTTVSDNRVTTLGQGGGIYNAGTLQIYDSTISGNVNEETRLVCQDGCAGGGGIYSTGNLQIINSTVSSNTAPIGSGLLIFEGTLQMSNSTISPNNVYTDPNAGAILIFSSATTTTMMNSIVVGQVAGQLIGDNCGSIYGNRPITSIGYNLADDGSCYINAAGDKSNNQNVKLGPLQNNGGLTKTHALSSGSDAIDAGDPTGCKDVDGKPLTADQRGFIRPVNGGSGTARCDMGAYEFNSTPP